jgi:serine phosphatase RsbU (regulator of sigma subunit)
MDGEKYWSKNPGKFRTIILLLSVLMIFAIVYNIINYASTVFSGTVYMKLPSSIYINQNLTVKNNKGADETIPAGSFILSLNGKTISTQEEYENILKNYRKDSAVNIRIFNVVKGKGFSETTQKATFEALADTFSVKKSELQQYPVKFFKTGSFIGYVIPDGATDRAGLKSGDVLLTIRDRDVTMMQGQDKDGFDLDFYRFFRSQPKGEPIPYKIVRAGESLTINVWIASFGIPTMVFFVVVCGLAFIFLGLYYGLKRPNFIAARLTAMAFILLGFEIVIGLNIGYAGYDIYSFIKVYISNLSLLIFQPVMFHSLLYFPGRNDRILNHKWHIKIFYLISLTTFLLFSYWYFTDMDKVDNGVIMFLIIGNMVYYTTIRLLYSKNNFIENRKVSFIINMMWVFIYFVTFIVSVMSFFGYKNFPVWFIENNFVVLFLAPLAYLYFTWRYRLLDIDFRLRRNIQYVLITVLWNAVLISLFAFILWKASFVNAGFPNIKLSLSSIEILSVPLDVTTNLFYNKLLFILISFISGVILYKVRNSVQSIFDKKFYRQKFDYKYAQEELVRLFQKKFTIDSLARVIVEKVSTLVRVKEAGVVFTGDNRDWDGKLYCYNNQESRVYYLNMEKRYYDSIKGFKGTFSINYLPAESKEFLDKNKFLSVVPIKVNERLLGALFIGEKLSETPLKGEDFEFLSAIVTSTSIAVENAFLYEELTKRERMKRELEIAHHIQVASLPQNVPVVPGLDIFATSIPALEVGGDFYDFLNGTANGLTIVMGDVSGKGTSAALYMSKVQGIFQTLHEFNLSPVKLMTRANHLLHKHIDSKSYITAVGANFDTENKTLSFARAGHLPLYYYNFNLAEIRKIQPMGMGLGLSEKNIFDYSIEEIKIEYSTGDIFMFVSDGVIEALNRAGEQFGETKLLELIKRNSGCGSEEIVNGILESVKAFTSDTSQFDDITVVTVKSV